MMVDDESSMELSFRSPSPNKKQKRTARERTPEESPSQRLMSYLIVEKKAEREAPGPSKVMHDPVEAFLIGIGATLRTFNPLQFNKTKRKIFDIVHDIEFRQLTQTEVIID